jgi:hypothetical protein
MEAKMIVSSKNALISIPEEPEVAYSGKGLLERFIILKTGVPIAANVGKIKE